MVPSQLILRRLTHFNDFVGICYHSDQLRLGKLYKSDIWIPC